ncbi:MAG: 3-phosphoshikimate 1-carboxyvinyltransferase, partial [Oscillospiraceae bacterium]
MTVTITPTRLEGTLTPPPSKSQAHRLLIAAALAGGTSQIENLANSEDIAATKNCLTALLEKTDRLPTLDCHESGSTLRFFIPLALALRGGGVFTGSTRLMERPQDPYFAIFRE